jgi:isocitrate/isopropylmalate dehydrogenase
MCAHPARGVDATVATDATLGESKMAVPECPVRIGLAIGEGTGRELADVFEVTIREIAHHHSISISVDRSPRVYQSYHSLCGEDDADVERVAQLTQEDAAHYEDFCRRLSADGVPAVFRTALNAQSLYLVRQRLHAVKVEHLVAPNLEILLIRDQAQGFYTGDNFHDLSNGLVVRRCVFSQTLTSAILAFAIGEARRTWGHDGIDRVILAYKYHLLDGCFSAWVRRASDEHHLPIDLYQPDTANRLLLRNGMRGRVLLIGANEWADIMHVVLLDRFGLGSQESRFTRNVYLHPSVAGLVVYQTVHGSADDLAGKRQVNPMATLRAAAAIMERHAGCRGCEAAMEQALLRAAALGIATRDLGGATSTDELTTFALRALVAEYH